MIRSEKVITDNKVSVMIISMSPFAWAAGVWELKSDLILKLVPEVLFVIETSL